MECLRIAFPSNITSTSIDRSAQSVKQVNETLENFDKITHAYRDKGQHVPLDTFEDFRLVLQVLQSEHVFTQVPGGVDASKKSLLILL